MNAAPLTPEQAEAFRRLLAGEDAVITGECGLVLRSPELEVVVSVWPTEEDEEAEKPAPPGTNSLPQTVSAPALDAVYRQGRAAAPAVLADLARLLDNEDGAIRAAAARAVRDLGSAAATPEVLARLPLLLGDPEAVVRDAAAAALGSLGSAAVTPAVLTALAPLLFATDWHIGAAAAEAVSRMGCSAAIEEAFRTMPPSLLEPQTAARSAVTERTTHHGLFDMLVSVFEPGGKHIRLDGIALRAHAQAGTGIPHRSDVTERGDLTIKGLRQELAFRLDCERDAGGSRKLPIIVILWAHPLRRVGAEWQREGGRETGTDFVQQAGWELMTNEGDPNIPLPSEVAQRCYGTPEQTVTVCVQRVPVIGAPERFEPQLEVSPAPSHAALTFTLAFANGERRELTVPVPRRRRSSATSLQCEALPADAFGGADWQLKVEVGISDEPSDAKT